MEQLPSYQPNLLLMRKVNREWRRYVDGEGGLYYKWLALAMKIVRPRLIVELGTYTGMSALMMYAEMDQYARLVSVDMQDDRRFIPPEMLADSRVRFVVGDDLDLRIFRNDVPWEIDFLFLDTEHTYRQILREWTIYQHLLADEALVVLDDIRLNDVPIFWDQIEYEKIDLTHVCHHSGFGIFFYRRQGGKAGLSAALKASSRILSESRNQKKQRSLQRGFNRMKALLTRAGERQ